MPTRAELYRKRATESEAVAERANDADRKARLREAAKHWADLAERVEQLDGENCCRSSYLAVSPNGHFIA